MATYTEYHYLVTDHDEVYFLAGTKREAEIFATENVDCSTGYIHIYKLEHEGGCFIPDPEPVFERD